jgi:hypothetical protein
MATPVSFLDLINPGEVQEAFQQSRELQQREKLAVTPKPNLRPAIQRAKALDAGARALTLRRRQIDIAEKGAKFQRRFGPVTTAVGALSGLTSVAGAFGDRRQANLRAQKRQARLAQQTQFAEERRRQHEELMGVFAKRRRQALAPAGSNFGSFQPGF